MTKERIAELRAWFPNPSKRRSDDMVRECLDEIERLQDVDIIARYPGNDGSREWVQCGSWLMPGQALAVVSMP